MKDKIFHKIYDNNWDQITFHYSLFEIRQTFPIKGYQFDYDEYEG
jgi:hypothetical protein